MRWIKASKYKKSDVAIDIISKKIDDEHQAAFWYEGTIAFLSVGKRMIEVEIEGEISVKFADGKYGRDQAAVKMAYKRKITDKDFDALEWGEAPWFSIGASYKYNYGDGYIDESSDVIDDYDEAMEYAMDIILDDGWWEQQELDELSDKELAEQLGKSNEVD